MYQIYQTERQRTNNKFLAFYDYSSSEEGETETGSPNKSEEPNKNQRLKGCTKIHQPWEGFEIKQERAQKYSSPY
jgi:hypothetical protein